LMAQKGGGEEAGFDFFMKRIGWRKKGKRTEPIIFPGKGNWGQFLLEGGRKRKRLMNQTTPKKRRGGGKKTSAEKKRSF